MTRYRLIVKSDEERTRTILTQENAESVEAALLKFAFTLRKKRMRLPVGYRLILQEYDGERDMWLSEIGGEVSIGGGLIINE